MDRLLQFWKTLFRALMCTPEAPGATVPRLESPLRFEPLAGDTDEWLDMLRGVDSPVWCARVERVELLGEQGGAEVVPELLAIARREGLSLQLRALNAITQVARRTGTPEARAALPLLLDLAAPRSTFEERSDKRRRGFYLRLYEEIEKATEPRLTLPIPASGQRRTLPVPASGEPPHPAELPVPGSPPS
jgi:hypothetical protein